MKLFPFLLFASFLSATVNDPLRVEVFSGYRNDRVHWHLQEPGDGGAILFSSLYKDVQFFENGLNFQLIHRDLAFFCQGSYACLGRGDIQLTVPNSAIFQSSSEGWAANGFGYVGYAANLTEGRLYQFIVTPLIGYGGYFESLKSKGVPSKLDLSLNGVFFGVQLTYNSYSYLLFKVGYAYNLIHDRIHSHLGVDEEGNLSQSSFKSVSGGNPGQRGWAILDFKLKSDWRFGFGAALSYFTTRVVDATLRQGEVPDQSTKLKVRWTPISCGAHLSRKF